MADRYIDIAYVDACLDATVRAALCADAAEINLLIEDATADVKGLMRNSGWPFPATPIDVATVDPTVRSAVMCGVWERLSIRPRNALELPPNWEAMPYKRAYNSILSGDVVPSPANADTAVGAWIFTDATTKTGPGKLRGY